MKVSVRRRLRPLQSIFLRKIDALGRASADAAQSVAVTPRRIQIDLAGAGSIGARSAVEDDALPSNARQTVLADPRPARVLVSTIKSPVPSRLITRTAPPNKTKLASRAPNAPGTMKELRSRGRRQPADRTPAVLERLAPKKLPPFSALPIGIRAEKDRPYRAGEEGSSKSPKRN